MTGTGWSLRRLADRVLRAPARFTVSGRYVTVNTGGASGALAHARLRARDSARAIRDSPGRYAAKCKANITLCNVCFTAWTGYRRDPFSGPGGAKDAEVSPSADKLLLSELKRRCSAPETGPNRPRAWQARGQNPPGIRTATHPRWPLRFSRPHCKVYITLCNACYTFCHSEAALCVAPRANSAAIPPSSRLAGPAPRRSRCSGGFIHGLLSLRVARGALSPPLHA